MRFFVLLAFGLSGAAALIYEVAWTREVTLVLGSTTYALSTMLSAFMAGLAAGGFFGGKLADRSSRPVFHFGVVELGIGVFGLMTVPLIHALSPYYFSLYKTFNLSPVAFMTVQFLVCFGVMLIPTALMGVTFPVVSKAVTDSAEKLGQGVGSAYSSNTFGAILGSLAAGFLLIPVLGIRYAVITAACLNLFAGLMLLLSKSWKPGPLTAVFLALLAAASIMALNYQEAARVNNFYTAGRYDSLEEFDRAGMGERLLFDKDFAEGRVRLWKDGDGALLVQVGGKNEGTSKEDLANTRMLAYLPIAAHPRPGSFLVIGLGAGVTLGAAREHLRDVSLSEINAGVVEAIRKHALPGLLDGVDVVINDARNYLSLIDRKFDIISSEPSYPTDPGTGNLFTREYYELARGRLNPGGLYCQWLPYYILSDNDVTMMLRTFGSVFPNVYLWKVPGSLDLILLGSVEPFKYGADEIIRRARALNTHEEALDFMLSRGPEQVKQIIAENGRLPLNTDDRPVLEFHAAMNFITGK